MELGGTECGRPDKSFPQGKDIVQHLIVQKKKRTKACS